MIAVRDTIAVLDSELQTESGEVARWCLACCAVSTLVLLWVVSYSYRFSVSFNRSGNFARRVETNYDRLSCNRGTLWDSLPSGLRVPKQILRMITMKRSERSA